MSLVLRNIFFWTLLSLCTCTKTAPPTKTLRTSFSTTPATFEPKRASDFPSCTLATLLFEGLTRNQETNEIAWGIAYKADISPDQKTYTFFLRPSLWNDGTELTANDFVRSWKEALALPSPTAYLFYPIQGVKAFCENQGSLDEVAIRAIDATTLEVVLERPTPYFLSLTSFPLFRPYAPGKSNGPFELQTFTDNKEIVLKKNPLFWNPHLVQVDAIQFHILPNEAVTLAMFQNQELDIIGGALAPIPSDALPSLQNKGLFYTPMNATTFCALNTKAFPFESETARKAFALAIDWESIAKEVSSLGQFAIESFLPPTLHKGPLYSPTYDPLLAKTLWQEAFDAPPQTLTLCYKAHPIDKQLAQILAKNWEQTLGVTIRLEQEDHKTLLQRLYAKNYTLAIACWIAQFDDPINILERYKDPRQPKNYANWDSPPYQELLAKAEGELDPTKRDELLCQATEIFQNSHALLPLYHWGTPTLLGEEVSHFSVGPSGCILWDLCEKR